MHDKNGTPIKVGDTVTIECVVRQVSPGEFCSLDVETVEKMPGNQQTNHIYALNAAQVLLTKVATLALLIACLAGCSTASASTDHRAAEVDAATVFSYATFVGLTKPAPSPTPAPPRPGDAPQLPEPDPISTPDDEAPSDEPAQPEQHAAAPIPRLAELIERTAKQRNAEPQACTGPRCGKSQASAPARPLRRPLGGLFRRG